MSTRACDFALSICRVLPAALPIIFFFFNDTATTEIYTLSLHDALPISPSRRPSARASGVGSAGLAAAAHSRSNPSADRKSTRLNSSHVRISYAVFCLKKKIDTRNGINLRAGRQLPAAWDSAVRAARALY